MRAAPDCFITAISTSFHSPFLEITDPNFNMKSPFLQRKNTSSPAAPGGALILQPPPSKFQNSLGNNPWLSPFFAGRSCGTTDVEFWSINTDPKHGIRGVQVRSHSSRPLHSSQMGSFLGVVRVLLLCLLVSAVGAKDACKQPKVRREWRKLTPGERAEWIDAVKVLIS